jgi:hypothetical protein
MEAGMPTHPSQESSFFYWMARRIYQARLEKAEREVKRHPLFLSARAVDEVQADGSMK